MTSANDNLRMVIQGIIAVAVLIIGGLFAYLRPDTSGAAWGVIGTVVAYYFLSATQTNTMRMATQAFVQAMNVQSQPSSKQQGK